MTTSTFAIIGTAGRRDDAARLNADVYARMIDDARRRYNASPDYTLVSGGAAWADHLAVLLFLDGTAPKLTLHLPAEFRNGRFISRGFSNMDPARISTYYHSLFSKALGRDTLAEISAAVEKGAQIVVTPGFKQRNSLVAQANVLVAYTFGQADRETGSARTFVSTDPGWRDPIAAGLKDGGTADTWRKSTAGLKTHVPIASLPPISA